MKNWSTTQIVLTLIGVFAFGMVLGYFIPPFNTWFPAKPEEGKVGERNQMINSIADQTELRKNFTRENLISELNKLSDSELRQLFNDSKLSRTKKCYCGNAKPYNCKDCL